jgi:hypothetical protein
VRSIFWSSLLGFSGDFFIENDTKSRLPRTT